MFNDDIEKFYSNFYGLLSENVLLEILSGDVTLVNILMIEVANHLVIHLSEKNIPSEYPLKSNSVNLHSEREVKCLQCLSGYIIHKLYTKYRFSKNYCSQFNKQCIAILLACKTDSDNTQTLIDARDSGGLWKTNKTMQQVFLKCENIFREKTAQFSTKIITTDLLELMMESSVIKSCFQTLCYEIDPKVDKEISSNLLEQILTLFIHVRTFSFAKDLTEKQKLSKKTLKKHSIQRGKKSQQPFVKIAIFYTIKLYNILNFIQFFFIFKF